MKKSIHGPRAEAMKRALIAIRHKAGLTQRQLAQRMGTNNNFIARVELGERRVDLVEFWDYCRACNVDPFKQAKMLMKTFETLEP